MFVFVGQGLPVALACGCARCATLLDQQVPGNWTVPPLRQSDRIAIVCLSGTIFRGCLPEIKRNIAQVVEFGPAEQSIRLAGATEVPVRQSVVWFIDAPQGLLPPKERSLTRT